MIIVDKALARLEAEGRPIRVAVIGAGFQGAAVVRQIVKSTPGMRVVGVANRRGEAAVRAYADVGVEASRVEEIGRAHVCTPVTNAHLVCRLLLAKKKKNYT